jgi:hypothetical protein
MSSKIRDVGIKQRPWVEVFYAEIAGRLGLAGLRTLETVLAGDPDPERALLLGHVRKAIEYQTQGVRNHARKC